MEYVKTGKNSNISALRNSPFLRRVMASFMAAMASAKSRSYGAELRQLSGQVLQVFLENGSEESAENFHRFLINHLPDGSHIDQWGRYGPLSGNRENHELGDPLKSQVLLAFAQWIDLRIRSLDALVPLQTNALTMCHARLQNHIAMVTSQTSELPSNSDRTSVMSDFIYHVVLQLLGSDFACFAHALALSLPDVFTQHPALLLSQMVQQLEHCRAKVAQVALELAQNFRLHCSLIMKFCRFFTVQFQDLKHSLLEHETCTDIFQQSPFGIRLIDSYSSLLMMLLHIERHQNLVLAVDFEGVKLNRSGQLTLIQITCSDMPSHVYVLDVCTLPLALHFATPSGTSLKTILENTLILKIWFDPRNDVDALFHQFGIAPQQVFDLQLAEVAKGRSKGLQVNFVPSLQKCLSGCDRLSEVQKTFAEKINRIGKQLFEPDHGGQFEVFKQRPLLDDLLVYSAHDCRYMHALYQFYLENLSDEWIQRVLAGSQLRAQWFAHTTYLRPSTDAPDF